MTVQTQVVGTGRSLSYLTYGPVDGPVVLLHDGYGSHLVARLARETALAMGVRIVAPDRPGFWQSSPLPGDPLVTWPADVQSLLEALGIERCAVLGASAGCPLAFAAAVALPDAIAKIAIAGPAAPIADVRDLSDLDPSQRRSMLLARRAPRVAAASMLLMAEVAHRWPTRAVKFLIAARPAADATRMREVDMMAALVEMVPELFGDGRATGAELRALVSDWGPVMEQVTQPTRIWSGDQDSVHPVSMGRHLARHIPGATHETVSGAFMAVMDRVPEILDWAVSDWA